MKKSGNKIRARQFDKKFNKGEDVGNYLDIKKAHVNRQSYRINIDFPASFLIKIDKEAKRIGVARTALIKLWLSERLEHGQY